MLRRPPRSTLFPYTTSSDLCPSPARAPTKRLPCTMWMPQRRSVASTSSLRSEEHTSELQSHSDLVCRLLLEKKKKKKHRQSEHDRRRHSITKCTTSSADAEM